MANINIKEFFGSDNILTLAEKLNFNFDQLILGGGGPEGPQGATGLQGISGPEGIRGSQWFSATGATGTINLPTDGVFRDNDFRLNENGDIEFYNGSSWLDTGINITGPEGPQGPAGDGTISTLLGDLKNNPYFGVNEFSPNYSKLQLYLAKNFGDDKDDYKFSADYINSGLDFIGLGKGNNSLVLGRYASLFRNSATGSGSKYSPPNNGEPGNRTMKNIPSDEADIPMLWIAQNDYKDPASPSSEFTNGIVLGLNKSHVASEYNSIYNFDNTEMSFNDTTSLSIQNRFFDFKIKSKSRYTFEGTDNQNIFRVSYRSNRPDWVNAIDMANLLQSDAYTYYTLGDNFVSILTNDAGVPNNLGHIRLADYSLDSNNQLPIYQNDNRTTVSSSYFTSRNSNNSDSHSTEIVLTNSNITGISSAQTLDIDNGKIINNYEESFALNSSSWSFPQRLGQTVVNPKITVDGLQTIDAKINITYQGQGYETGLIQYSGIDSNGVGGGLNTGTTTTLDAVVNVEDDGSYKDTTEILGYDIVGEQSPLQNQEGSRSMTRLGLFPGMFRQEKDILGNYDPNDSDSQKRVDEYFDTSHKLLPTGSLDLYGTVRLREQGNTNDGAKDGQVVINKKDGILGFEEPSNINAVPSFAIVTFPMMVSDKFSFYVDSKDKRYGALGSTESGKYVTYKPYDYKGTTGTNAVYPGRGKDELKDYFLCNGAVLADTRDIIARGPWSKIRGNTIEMSDLTVENNSTSSDINDLSNLEYTANESFQGMMGQTLDTLLTENGSRLVDIAVNGFNSANFGFYWGYSILAPASSDSAFRIVLPNYFGKVPKMKFVDSDAIIRAVSGQRLSGTGSGTGSATDGWKYYTEEGYINSQYMHWPSFEAGGSPYIDGRNLPWVNIMHDGINNNTGHNYGDGIPRPNWWPKKIYEVENIKKTRAFGTWNEVGINTEETGDYGNTYYNNRFFADRLTGDENGGSYFNSDVYSHESNWYRYGQKFFEPPFKGSLLAINLSNVTNPNRGGSKIPDFDFIAGIPMQGFGSNMGWFSYLGNSRLDAIEFCSTSKFYETYTSIRSDTPEFNYYGDYFIRAFEAGYKNMPINDDTMHPNTYYNKGDYRIEGESGATISSPLYRYSQDTVYNGAITARYTNYINQAHSSYRALDD